MPRRRPLDEVRVTEPCPRTWESLSREGRDDRFRSCDACHRKVFDLSALTRQEAQELVETHRVHPDTARIQTLSMQHPSYAVCPIQPLVLHKNPQVVKTSLAGGPEAGLLGLGGQSGSGTSRLA